MVAPLGGIWSNNQVGAPQNVRSHIRAARLFLRVRRRTIACGVVASILGAFATNPRTLGTRLATLATTRGSKTPNIKQYHNATNLERTFLSQGHGALRCNAQCVAMCAHVSCGMKAAVRGADALPCALSFTSKRTRRSFRKPILPESDGESVHGRRPERSVLPTVSVESCGMKRPTAAWRGEGRHQGQTATPPRNTSANKEARGGTRWCATPDRVPAELGLGPNSGLSRKAVG